MSGTGQTESRLGLADVPEEISRIFFGTGSSGGPRYRAGYGAGAVSTGYGAVPTGYGAVPAGYGAVSTGYGAGTVGQGQYGGLGQGVGWYTGGEKSVG